jgi:hypothetical protein
MILKGLEKSFTLFVIFFTSAFQPFIINDRVQKSVTHYMQNHSQGFKKVIVSLGKNISNKTVNGL